MQHVKNFFDTHPEAAEVHEALGVLFTSKEDADQFCAGTGKVPVTHARQISVPDEEDQALADNEMKAAIEEEVQNEEEVDAVDEQKPKTKRKSK